MTNPRKKAAVLTLSEIKRKAVPLLKKNDVVQAGIFGSYARGEQKKRSDIDVLVKFKKKKSLLDDVRLERKLKEKLGKKVDLLTYRSINPLLKKSILKDEVRIL